ncbi:hypothetical protein FPF80_01125 [Salmonella enterica subsp. enterica]|nr:hypothetical protein [Salmonella enterica subsp. enterica serovar Typhimurium]ECH1286376.1 hypothetical protein [Salmonella enterica subsp. enterica serovar Typhimurium]ECK0317833.1 hypothetical protein [Salmonella enterica subsp. enterica serovar Typhimurium]ECR1804273.1 hypothetical protein [Salmonella enterica subsp. enterica serovar Typhimurium]
MKLIDIVIMELSKRGGWPEKAACVVQDADMQICFSAKTDGLRKLTTDWIGGEWNGPWVNFFSNHLAGDYSTSIVTKQQYEAALVAIKPEWDGNGLPPIGCEIEVNSPRYGWKVAVVTAVTDSWLVAKYSDGVEFAGCHRSLEVGKGWTDNHSVFRPIRSEADKKKEAALSQIANAIIGDVPDTGMATAAMYAERIYDAIKSGKIVID